MKDNSSKTDVITHDFPVWREKSNFILAKYLGESDTELKYKWEQIWARQLEENLFEICCIPFFAYGLALGDLVDTTTQDDKEYSINKVLKKSGHTTYRIWFTDIKEWDLITGHIINMGCLVEKRWDKSKLIAVDAPDSEIQEELESYLTVRESLGGVKCEIGI